MARPKPDPAVVVVMILSGALYLGLAAIGWRGWKPLTADPMRFAGCVLVIVLSLASGLSDINLKGFRRPDAELRWLLVPLSMFTVVIAWLPAETDRLDFWSIDGSSARALGVILLALGGVLRVVPMFVLGERFTWPLATQETHRLVTTGLYRWIRHPSYLGALMGGVGWVLIFRSGLGLLLMLSLLPVFVLVLTREEGRLLTEFGEKYAAYRARTWRLIPWVY